MPAPPNQPLHVYLNYDFREYLKTADESHIEKYSLEELDFGFLKHEKHLDKDVRRAVKYRIEVLRTHEARRFAFKDRVKIAFISGGIGFVSGITATLIVAYLVGLFDP